MKTTKSVLGKALLPAVIVIALALLTALGLVKSHLMAQPTPPSTTTVCDVVGAAGNDGCYGQPFPCYSTQAFWLSGLDSGSGIFGTACGNGPAGATDGFHYIFTVGPFSITPKPGTLTETPGGTATLTGHIESTLHPGYGFDVNITFATFSPSPNGNGPLLELKQPSCYGTGANQANTATWHYYTGVNSATLTGTGNYAGATVQLTPVMHFPQFGFGANGKNLNNGASGWFTWNVTNQPSNTNFRLNTNPQPGFQADFNIDCNNPHTPGCAGSIGDFVWQDTNGNGCQDAGEPGMQNVQVDLYTGCGTGKVFKTSQNTDANGHYLFTNLCAGNYTVCFHTPNGFTTTASHASCGTNPNLVDSDCPSGVCDICVNLPTDTSSDVTIDCGYIPQCTGSIGDFVWQDTNGNGCQDAGESGMQNVQVDLYTGCGTSKVFVTSQNTDANGHYLFTNLCAGNYTICFHTPNGFTTTGSHASCGTGSNLKDSDCPSGVCDICVNLPTNSSSDTTIDCGYIPQCTGSIGDFVWQDTNGNGCQDAGESGMQNVQVDLYTGCGTSKVFVTSQNTDANGHYLFTNLCAGNYTICFHTPNGFTTTGLHASCGTGSNLKDSDCPSGVCDICVNLPTNNSSDTTIDCGYIPQCTGSIGDFVWQDTNGNGCQDAGEPGMQNVQVDLYNGCATGKVFVTSQNTDANGHYLFTNLCAGNYTICFHTPNGFATTGVGANCGANSNLKDSNCPSGLCDICVNLPTNSSSDTTIDCGYIPSCPVCVNPDLGLGVGANFSVFELANGKVSITGPAGGIVGMVAIGPNGSLSMSGDEFITGTIKLAPGAKFQNSAHFTPVVQTNVDLTAQINAAKNRSTTAAALPCTQPAINKIDGVAVTTITGVVGTNVICVKDVSISGKQVYVTGPVGAKFIFNVTGQFTLTGGGNGPQIRAAGGVTPADILWNLVGTQNMTVAFSGGGGGTNCCAAIVDGTLLAVNRSINLSPGLVNGEIISGKDINIVSGSAIKCPNCPQ